MKIGYITKQNPEDKKAYSGIHFNMMKALERHFDKVLPIGPVDPHFNFLPKFKGKVLKAFSGKTYKYQYDIGLAKRASAIIDEKIKQLKPDALLASLMSPEVAYLKSEIPLYITTDATFPLLNELYQSHSNLHPKSIKEALHLEERAFKNAKKLILPLNWLADSAMNDYDIPSKKIEVIPYGSNLDLKFSEDEIAQIIKKRQKSSKLKLLFVGVRWKEKGGPFAVEVLKELLKKGVKAELTVVGCAPEIPDKPDEVNILGFLNKEVQADSEKLFQLYKEANFFILPTKAECIGMSFIEAASVALPAIGSNIGGVPEAIEHDKTGFICEDNHSPKDVAEWIKKVISDKALYENLSQKAFHHQQEKMNWQNWGKKVRMLIETDLA